MIEAMKLHTCMTLSNHQPNSIEYLNMTLFRSPTSEFTLKIARYMLVMDIKLMHDCDHTSLQAIKKQLFI